MPRLILNGQAHDVPAGTLLLDALAAAGSPVPQLCHDARLAPSGGCRLCLVAIDGQPLPLPACATRAEDGMVVHSHTPALEALRHSNLQLLAERYPTGAVALLKPLLRDEVDRNLAMLGATGCSELGPQHIARQRS